MLFLLHPGRRDATCEGDRATGIDMGSAIFDGGKSTPVTEVEEPAGVVDICFVDGIEPQVLAGCVHQVVEAAGLSEQLLYIFPG